MSLEEQKVEIVDKVNEIDKVMEVDEVDSGKCCCCFSLGCGVKTLTVLFLITFISNIINGSIAVNQGNFAGWYQIIMSIPVSFMLWFALGHFNDDNA